MTAHNKNIPKLRFKEFDEVNSYKRHRFNDIFLFATGKNIKQNEASPEFETPCVRYGELYHMYNEVIKKVFNRTNLDRSELVFSQGDEILLPSAGEDPLDIGSASALTLENIAIGRTINILKPKKANIYSQIYVSYYINQKLRRKISTLAKGVSISNVYNSDLKTLEIIFPNLPEQQKIASFLSSVDEKIQQLTRKKELLEQYKKGVMQQLFSGKLRFKPENGKAYPKWEEKRLDEVVSKFMVPMRDKPKDLTGPIPWCRIEDFDGKYLSKSKSGQGVNLETIKEMNLKVYPVGTLLVSCSANLGFCAITKAELMTNQTFIGLVPDVKKIDVLFLFYVMRRSSVKLNTLSSGTTISYLSRQQFEKFKIPYPSLLEQKKLTSYISNIDDKIETVATQITQTQTFKKGLLQQMFV